MSLFPPHRIGPTPQDQLLPWVELRREVGMDDVEVTVPSGDTYDLTLDEARLYLIRLFVPLSEPKKVRAEKVLDQLWNSYALRLEIDASRDYPTEVLEAPQYPETIGPRPLEEHGWIIEAGRVR